MTYGPDRCARMGAVAQYLALTPVFSSIESRSSPWRFTTRGVTFRLFLTCWFAYALHFATNTVREIYPALSLGDHLSFDVSEYEDLHPDIFDIPGRGAFINSNPGASILGAVPYALARPLIDRVVEHVEEVRAGSPESSPEYDTIYPMAREFYRKANERGLDVKFALAAGVIQVSLMAPLSALSALFMFRILLSLTGSAHSALMLAILYAFATPVFYRTAQLNHNVLVGHFALFAFALLWRPWDERLSPQRPQYFLAGALSGWAVVLDYSGALVPLVFGLYALIRRSSLPACAKKKCDLFHFVIGVMLSVSVLFGYQWVCFGNPFYPAQHYMPPATYTHQGYRGMDWPQLDLLWDTAFDMRFGLFTSAPILLLALYVPGWFRRHRIVGDLETWCILTFSTLFFLFCAANQYGRMQFNSGIRHVVPVTPFLFLLAAGVLLRMPRTLAVTVGIVSTYWSWCLCMYRDVEQGLGVLESLKHITLGGFRLPWITTLERLGYIPNGASPVPLLMFLGAILWALWSVGAATDRSR